MIAPRHPRVPTVGSTDRDKINVVLDQRPFVLDAERFDAFAAILGKPQQAGQGLKALMKRRPSWER